MRKTYNYRNPTVAEIERRERTNEVISWVGVVLAVLNLVGWALVLK